MGKVRRETITAAEGRRGTVKRRTTPLVRSATTIV
jgi:hypothetical protein